MGFGGKDWEKKGADRIEIYRMLLENTLDEQLLNLLFFIETFLLMSLSVICFRVSVSVFVMAKRIPWFAITDSCSL